MLIQRINNKNYLGNPTQDQSSLIFFLTFFNKAMFGCPSTVQNLGLNRIEIGQFLKMKYRLIGASKTTKNIKLSIKLLKFLSKKVSDTINTNGTPTNSAYKNKYGLCSSVNIFPSLLEKVKTFINFVPLNIFNINGTPISVSQNKTDDQYENVFVFLPFCAILNDKPNPKLIPNQNTKFQKRSLVSHFSSLSGKAVLLFSILGNFVKSCITHFSFIIKLYLITISKFSFISKRIITLCTVMTIFCGWNVSQASSREEILTIISRKEQEYNIPSGLLLAIAKTESNLKPLALNISGYSVLPQDKSSALKTIRKALNKGINNIDIGIAQINYKWHQDKFDSIESMLLPELNINYAASLLAALKTQHGDWHKALRHYHSAKPAYHKHYSRKVVLCWLGV
jgi:hypothetical protein